MLELHARRQCFGFLTQAGFFFGRIFATNLNVDSTRIESRLIESSSSENSVNDSRLYSCFGFFWA
jgi:hypothetical protein